MEGKVLSVVAPVADDAGGCRCSGMKMRVLKMRRRTFTVKCALG